jgi:invasion protein IalB
MIARSFSKALMSAALAATAVVCVAASGPAMAQSQQEKAPAQPFKLDKVVPEHEIPMPSIPIRPMIRKTCWYSICRTVAAS